MKQDGKIKSPVLLSGPETRKNSSSRGKSNARRAESVRACLVAMTTFASDFPVWGLEMEASRRGEVLHVVLLKLCFSDFCTDDLRRRCLCLLWQKG